MTKVTLLNRAKKAKNAQKSEKVAKTTIIYRPENYKKNAKMFKSRGYIQLKGQECTKNMKKLSKCSNVRQIYVKITLLYGPTNDENGQKYKNNAKLCSIHTFKSA